jgi:hypothetical protein
MPSGQIPLRTWGRRQDALGRGGEGRGGSHGACRSSASYKRTGDISFLVAWLTAIVGGGTREGRRGLDLQRDKPLENVIRGEAPGYLPCILAGCDD